MVKLDLYITLDLKQRFQHIGRFDPSSKLCSVCGKINKELTLNDREWKCSCGVDRDVNAATNIKNFGLRNQPNITQSEGLPCACNVEVTI